MKKNIMMTLALATMAAGVAVNAEEAKMQNDATAAQKAQACSSCVPQKGENVAAKISVEEQAFAAKLTDQNRKTFSEKLSVEQRKSVMVAVKNGANPDEAVQKLTAAKELKDASPVANAEKASPAATTTK